MNRDHIDRWHTGTNRDVRTFPFLTTLSVALRFGHVPAFWILLLLVFACSRNFQNPVFPDQTLPWPQPVEPPLCTITSDPTPAFSWDPVEGFEEYEMEIDDDPTFSSPTIRFQDISSNTFTVPNPLPDGQYFWRVRPQLDRETWTDWPESWIFVIDTAFFSPIAMHWVEGGSYQMGDTYGDGEFDEYPLHTVTLQTFAMSRFEITQEIWVKMMGNNPSGFIGNDNLPVERITWYEALEFCNALSRSAGCTPCYTIDGTDVSCNFDADGFRLPTEAEWEYAAKGGNRNSGYRYSGSNDIDEVAWYSSNADNMTHPVGGKKPNELGLFDMIGNVWEVCWDWYGSFSEEPAQDPKGADIGSFKIVRSGCWISGYEWTCRPSSRFWTYPHLVSDARGFRVVRSIR